MILTNKKTTYTVSHSNTTIKIDGNVSIREDNSIENFNGSFRNINEEEMPSIGLGNFSYHTVEGTVNKSIYGVPEEFLEAVEALLTEAIDELKIKVETDILSE